MRTGFEKQEGILDDNEINALGNFVNTQKNIDGNRELTNDELNDAYIIENGKKISTKQINEATKVHTGNLMKEHKIITETRNDIVNNGIELVSGKTGKGSEHGTKVQITNNSKGYKPGKHSIENGGFAKPEGSTQDKIENILGKNAFTVLLKQLSQLFALFFTNLKGGSSSVVAKKSIEDGAVNDINEKDNKIKEGDKKINIELSQNDNIDAIYDEYPSYKQYKGLIQSKSLNAGISEIEVIKLLTKENNIASIKASPEGSEAYGIGQMIPDTWNRMNALNGTNYDMYTSNAEQQITLAIVYMKHIKTKNQCNDSLIKVYYNTGENFSPDNTLVSRKYISGNLEPIVYSHPKYKGQTVDFIASRMTKKEYFIAANSYYNKISYNESLTSLDDGNLGNDTMLS